jgi:hypothetical protein
VDQVVQWIEQARASKGRFRPTLSVGRDGIFVPLRHGVAQEGATKPAQLILYASGALSRSDFHPSNPLLDHLIFTPKISRCTTLCSLFGAMSGHIEAALRRRPDGMRVYLIPSSPVRKATAARLEKANEPDAAPTAGDIPPRILEG